MFFFTTFVLLSLKFLAISSLRCKHYSRYKTCPKAKDYCMNGYDGQVFIEGCQSSILRKHHFSEFCGNGVRDGKCKFVAWERWGPSDEKAVKDTILCCCSTNKCNKKVKKEARKKHDKRCKTCLKGQGEIGEDAYIDEEFSCSEKREGNWCYDLYAPNIPKRGLLAMFSKGSEQHLNYSDASLTCEDIGHNNCAPAAVVHPGSEIHHATGAYLCCCDVAKKDRCNEHMHAAKELKKSQRCSRMKKKFSKKWKN